MSANIPRIKTILSTDFFALVCILAPLTILVLAIDDKYIGILSSFFSRGRADPGGTHDFFFNLSVFTTAVLVPYAIYRVQTIRKCFKDSSVIKGVITFAPGMSDRGRFSYSYTVNGEEYNSWNLVRRVKGSRAIHVGQTVDIVVYNKNPNKAFILELYI